MKAIFLSRNHADLERVYGREQREQMQKMLGFLPPEYNELPECCPDTEYIFSTWGMFEMTEDEIRRVFPALKAVFYAAGSVQYFAKPFIDMGIKVYSAWQANAVPVVQYAFGQILLALNGYYTVQAKCRNSRAESKELFAHYPGVYGEKVGLLGCGAIGSRLAVMLQNTDLEVLVYDPYLSDEQAEQLHVRKASLEEIFSTCFVISNHVPNLPSTVGLIKREHFFAMRPYAVFINTGRGPQLTESDLYDALTADPTRTALLDVMTDEGNSDTNPLNALSNCFITPHIAGSSGNEVRRMSDYMITALEAFEGGQACGYEVTQKMLLTMA